MTGEQFLDTLYRTPVAEREAAIEGMRTLATLRSAVDLAGHDAEGMTALRCRRILRDEWCGPRTMPEARSAQRRQAR
jgi:hypothetical protein